jgi:glutathione S-transferase
MKLYGIHLSPFVRKVAVVLAAKGLDYEQEVVMPGGGDADFHKLSPLGKIPVLVDGDQAIPDSSVICEYLEEQYPAVSVLPATPALRAQARFLEEYGDSKLVEAAAPIFIEKFAAPKFFGRECDEAKVTKCIEELLPPRLDYLEERVPAEGFLFGHFCTADISIVSPLFNSRYGGYEVDAQRWPNFAAYAKRVESHAPVAQALALEKKVVEGMLAG